MSEFGPTAVIDFCNKAIEEGADIEEVISQLALAQDTLSEDLEELEELEEDEDMDDEDEEDEDEEDED